MVQKPSVRPGRPPRDRPTGAPQSLRLQYRLRSGTSGFSSTAVRGSGRGTSGTDTRPAPSLPREATADVRELLTETERPVDSPVSARDSRPETDRRDARELLRDVLLDRLDALELFDELPRLPRPRPVTPVGAEPTTPSGDTTGARPQVSQYSSPPPTSSYVPPQPGR
ncbi:hypothetical protein GCM10009802_34290 [Streptomyces synnematoformans]|uniref:Uncharacterized protein n=1 Tax=Streptomyces synnematoformans TaxID=415721 RepID=A0ABN2YI95_9ACTN